MTEPTNDRAAGSDLEVDDLGTESGSEVDATGTAADAVAADAAAVAAAAAVFDHDVETLLAERDQFKDIALRLQADFENYRKRVATQQADEIDRSTGKLAESLLPVLDACEAAFAHRVEGVESIWSALIGALQKQGLQALDLAGKPFDPAVAEAVMHEPGDGAAGEPVVAEVLRSGYTWKGKVLRPAMVKVQG